MPYEYEHHAKTWQAMGMDSGATKGRESWELCQALFICLFQIIAGRQKEIKNIKSTKPGTDTVEFCNLSWRTILMEEVLTIAQIKAQFISEWVLVEDPQTNDALEVQK